MLAFFRKKKSYLNWVLWLMIPVLGAGMVLLFVDAPTGTSSGFGGNHVASVAGEKIPTLAFREAYQNLVDRYRQQFGENFQQIAAQLRLGDQAINALVTEYAVAYEAERLGLTVSPQEIQQKIISYPVFRDSAGNFVGVAQYEEILLHNNLSVGMFEKSVRHQLLREKLENVLTDGLEATEDEIREDFAKSNQQVKVSYVYFDREAAQVGEVADEELQKFFEENSEVYKNPERRGISYFTVPISPTDVELSEQAIQAKLESTPEVERVRASHILIKTPPGGDDGQARKKAQALLDQIRKGANFEKLARQNSEDEGSADKGGDLGFFQRGTMVPEFEKVAFQLEPGEVSDLVESPFGVHIIKTTAKPRTSADSRRLMAEFELREEEAGRRAKARAEALLARWKAGASLEELSQEEGIRTGRTPLFALTDSMADKIPVRQDFNQQIFALKRGEFNTPYLSNVQYVVALLDRIQAPQLPDFEEVKEKVLADYQEQKRGEVAERQAKQFFHRARKQGLAEAAREAGLAVTTTDFFKSGVNVDEILKFSPVLHDRAFRLEVGSVSPPVTVAEKLVVFEVVEKTPFDEQVYQEQKQEIAAQLHTEKRTTFFTSYIQNVVDRLREEEKIQIDRALINELAA